MSIRYLYAKVKGAHTPEVTLLITSQDDFDYIKSLNISYTIQNAIGEKNYFYVTINKLEFEQKIAA